MEKNGKQGIIKNAVSHAFGINLEKGSTVYEYGHPTQDCLLPNHVAISLDPKRETFYGVPATAVNWQ